MFDISIFIRLKKAANNATEQTQTKESEQ